MVTGRANSGLDVTMTVRKGGFLAVGRFPFFSLGQRGDRSPGLGHEHRPEALEAKRPADPHPTWALQRDKG